MSRGVTTWTLAAVLALCSSVAVRAQTVVDRIAARVENDVVFDSEIRELGRYQQLSGGAAQSREKLLSELIEQWIVKSEAEASSFPRPDLAEIDGEQTALEKQLGSADALRKRMRELGLRAPSVRRMLGDQLYIERYLEYKFRPAAQVESDAIEKYYREELVPAMSKRGQAAPALDEVQELIRELLVQQEISKRATEWIAEARTRLKVEIFAGDEKPAPGKSEK
jgi:hypothetical protein